MFFCVWDFIFQSSSFWDFPLVAFTCAVQTSTGASRRANRGCLRLGWCCFPTPPSDRPQIVAQGRVWFFLPRTNSPLPLKGEGRDFAHLWGFGFSLAVVFGNRWPQLAHTGPTGRVCCFSGVVPLPGSHNRTQGRTGLNLVSPSFLGVLLLRKSR